MAGLAVLCVLASCTPWANAAATSTDEAVVEISGVGAAHGFGMAMDGVQGQARAGWSHGRILDLFYPGTTSGHADGTIRVGLADAPTSVLTLPSGGSVSDAPRGGGAGPGFPVTLPPGGRIELAAKNGGISIARGLPTEPVEAEPATVKAQQEEPAPPQLLPTPPPILEPTPSPIAKKRQAPKPAPAQQDQVHPTIWVWGAGDPALVGVSETQRRYRGAIQVTPRGGKLAVVNHVGLESYVAGIAEEKGQGWPAAGLEALAIAARTLGAATMTWYDKNQANGYDICPTASCQLYLGYDGEEPAMSAATAATAGQIRTFRGRPILAMYHGNGGGQTESYKRAIGGGSDPHPYLSSVKYPFARPSSWQQETTLGAIEGALRAAEIGVPGRLEAMRVVERGESPRVMRMQLRGTDGTAEVSGVRFADALELRSTWFDFSAPGEGDADFASSDVFAAPGVQTMQQVEIGRGRSALPLTLVVAGAGALLSVAFSLRRRRSLAEGGDAEQLQRPRGDVGEHL
jgi:SpoIID/LytB domain protein